MPRTKGRALKANGASQLNGPIVRRKPFRDKAMDELLSAAKEQGVNLTELSNRALISRSTLSKWQKQETRYPQHMSLVCVAKPLGLAYRLVRVNNPDDE